MSIMFLEMEGNLAFPFGVGGCSPRLELTCKMRDGIETLPKGRPVVACFANLYVENPHPATCIPDPGTVLGKGLKVLVSPSFQNRNKPKASKY